LKLQIIGLDHETQWRDETGDFRKLLLGLANQEKPQLIAEEAFSLPTTVAQRLSWGIDVPWLDIDFAFKLRTKTLPNHGIKDMPEPDIDGNYSSRTIIYSKYKQKPRENCWLHQIRKHNCDSIWLICGLMHVYSLSEKLGDCDVHCVRVWEMDWYKEKWGKFILSNDGAATTAVWTPAPKDGEGHCL